MAQSILDQLPGVLLADVPLHHLHQHALLVNSYFGCLPLILRFAFVGSNLFFQLQVLAYCDPTAHKLALL